MVVVVYCAGGCRNQLQCFARVPTGRVPHIDDFHEVLGKTLPDATGLGYHSVDTTGPYRPHLQGRKCLGLLKPNGNPQQQWLGVATQQTDGCCLAGRLSCSPSAAQTPYPCRWLCGWLQTLWQEWLEVTTKTHGFYCLVPCSPTHLEQHKHQTQDQLPR